MTTHLSKLFRHERQAAGIKLGDLARRLGRRNITKACNKIMRFEEGGDIDQALQDELATILDISDDELWTALEADLTNKLNSNHERAQETRRLRRSYPGDLGSFRVIWPDEDVP